MFTRNRILPLIGALVGGGLFTLGAPTPAAAQFGPGRGYAYGTGIAPTGGFSTFNLSLGFGKGYVYNGGCSHGCRTPCGHVQPRPICPPKFRHGHGHGRFPGHGYGGGVIYREYRSGFGRHHGYGGPPRHGRFPGHGRGHGARR